MAATATMNFQPTTFLGPAHECGERSSLSRAGAIDITKAITSRTTPRAANERVRVPRHSAAATISAAVRAPSPQQEFRRLTAAALCAGLAAETRRLLAGIARPRPSP